MRDRDSEGSEIRRQRIRQEIESALESGELRLEESTPEDRMRTLGVAFVFFAKTVDVEVAEPEQKVDSDREIQALLHEWEKLAPDQFKANRRQYATDPYIGVGLHWAGTVDEKAVDDWLASDWLAEHQREYPSYSPRKVRLSAFHIVYLDKSRAVVTYRVEEEHKNGKLTAGNTASIVVNVADQGWRIMVDTKGGMEEISER